jgi:hypothetical protein
VNLQNSLFCQIFLAGFPSHGVFNKGPTVWLNGAWHANTCIPPSFPENTPMQLWGPHPTPKVLLQVLQKSKIQLNHFFIFKKAEKVLGKLNLGNSEFAACEIWHVCNNLVPTALRNCCCLEIVLFRLDHFKIRSLGWSKQKCMTVPSTH